MFDLPYLQPLFRNLCARSRPLSNEAFPERILKLEACEEEAWDELLTQTGNLDALESPDILPSTMRAMFERPGCSERERVQLAGARVGAEDLLEALSRDPSRKVREQVAKNPSTPRHVIEQLARKEGDTVVHRALAVASWTPFEVLLILANSEALLELATRPDAPLELQRALFERGMETGRRGVEGVHRNLAYFCRDAQLLHELSRSGEGAVRIAVAENAHTAWQTLQRLGIDDEPCIRAAVAVHPATPADVRTRLTKDRDQFVRDYATGRYQMERVLPPVDQTPKARPRAPGKWKERLDHWLKILTTTDASLFKSDFHRLERMEAALDPFTPDPILELISKDRRNDIARAVAENPTADTALVAHIESLDILRRHPFPTSPLAEAPESPLWDEYKELWD